MRTQAVVDRNEHSLADKRDNNEKRRLIVALIGQPNVGKSTLFNAITRGNAIVTNWPGTTVERHEGVVRHGEQEIIVVDLPGVYGLTGLTPEEKVSRDFIVKEKPDVLVVLVDSLNLERTLYLAVEVLELTGKAILAVTKIDEAHKKGIHINFEQLSKAVGVPVVPVSAARGLGLEELISKIVRAANTTHAQPIRVDYGELETFIDSIQDALERLEKTLPYPSRWVAVKLLEGDEELSKEVQKLDRSAAIDIENIIKEATRRLGGEVSALISKKRFEYAKSIAKSATVRLQIRPRKTTVEKFFYSPILAPALSAVILFAIFMAVFTINTGFPLTVLLESAGFYELAAAVKEHTLTSMLEKASEAARELTFNALGYGPASRFLVEGVLGGVLSLLSLAPLVLVVLIVLAVFEDSGLLTRMAVGFHTLLSRLELTGHSVFPVSLCLGCNVPGIMATRSNPNHGERLRLALLLPFIPCQARLVVLLAISSALGGVEGAVLVPVAYLIAFAIVVLFNAVFVKMKERRGVSETRELLLELPPIHRPISRVVWWFTWYYLKHFLVRVGTLIIAVNTILWVLTNVNTHLSIVEDPNESVAAGVARLIAPILKPIGVTGENSWAIVYALLAGFLAKELFLTSLLTVTGATSFREAVEVLGLSGPSLASIALFTALYVPCIATLATIYLETRRLKYVAISTALMLTAAYAITALVYTALSAFT